MQAIFKPGTMHKSLAEDLTADDEFTLLLQITLNGSHIGWGTIMEGKRSLALWGTYAFWRTLK